MKYENKKKGTALERWLYKELVLYRSPTAFSYLYSFGALAVYCLGIQIITGIFLSMHYKADVNLAFSSITHISMEVNYGWLLRYLHMNGASMFFIVVYIHIIRGIMYNSFTYPRQHLWSTGVIILFLMILTAFFGYVLPWGQMSFWAVTVITSLVTAIPYIGESIVQWIWGGFSVDDATLNRFYSFHFFFPFIIIFLSFIHIVYLHEYGSNNTMGVGSKIESLNFFPSYIIKDLYSMFLLTIFLSYLVFFNPDVLGHPDNFIKANPMVTPTHIVPEWYFLPFYAVLRSIPDKLLGFCALGGAVVMLLLLPFFVGQFTLIRSVNFRPFLKILIPIFVVNCLILGWVGGKPVEPPYYMICQFSSIVYFFLFFIFGLVALIEKLIILKFLIKN